MADPLCPKVQLQGTGAFVVLPPRIIGLMNRTELILRLRGRFPELSLQDCSDAVATMLSTLGDALAQGRRIEIRGFGAFSVHQHAARLSRNPKTGEAVAVSAKHAPRFKPGKELRNLSAEAVATRDRTRESASGQVSAAPGPEAP